MSRTNGHTRPEWGRIWRYHGKRGVVWRIRYRDASGRRILETLGREPEWTRTKAEAALRKRLVAVDETGYQQPEKLTFAAFAERWLSEYLPGRQLKLTTTDSYRQTINRHLLPHFGHHTLQHLERHPELIDRYITAKINSGLSAKSVNNQLLVLGVMLKVALRWRLIQRNPVTDCERPRLEQPELHVLSETQIAQLWHTYSELENGAKEKEKTWWRLARTITFVALGTAMRRGELLALRWHDIQLLEARIRVRQALVKNRFTTPKSRASKRTIEIGLRTRDLLAQHWQHTKFQGDDELVFSHPEKGTHLDASKLSRHYLRPALAAAGVTQPFRPFHDLRHTALTHDAAAGNPLAYIQMRAGHSQAAITERYIHAAQTTFPGAAQRAERRLLSALSNRSE